MSYSFEVGRHTLEHLKGAWEAQITARISVRASSYLNSVEQFSLPGAILDGSVWLGRASKFRLVFDVTIDGHPFNDWISLQRLELSLCHAELCEQLGFSMRSADISTRQHYLNDGSIFIDVHSFHHISATSTSADRSTAETLHQQLRPPISISQYDLETLSLAVCISNGSKFYEYTEKSPVNTDAGLSTLVALSNLLTASLRLAVSQQPNLRGLALRVRESSQPASLVEMAPSVWAPGYLAGMAKRNTYLPTLSHLFTAFSAATIMSGSLRSKLSQLLPMNRGEPAPASDEHVSNAILTRIWRIMHRKLMASSPAILLKPIEVITDSTIEEETVMVDGSDLGAEPCEEELDVDSEAYVTFISELDDDASDVGGDLTMDIEGLVADNISTDDIHAPQLHFEEEHDQSPWDGVVQWWEDDEFEENSTDNAILPLDKQDDGRIWRRNCRLSSSPYILDDVSEEEQETTSLGWNLVWERKVKDEELTDFLEESDAICENWPMYAEGEFATEVTYWSPSMDDGGSELLIGSVEEYCQGHCLSDDHDQDAWQPWPGSTREAAHLPIFNDDVCNLRE